MSATTRMSWNLLVLFVVLYQGIIGTVSEKDIDETSELLVRQKRVINRTPGADRKVPIRDFSFMVMIKPFRHTTYCAGVIVKPNIVLTAAKCVEPEIISYRVYSGSSQRPGYGSHPKIHNVTTSRPFLSNHPFRSEDGITLLTVTPPFSYSRSIDEVTFYAGNVQPGSHGIVSGWGCHPTGDPGTRYPTFLRSINVSIISNQECRTLFQNQIAISESDICTHDPPGQQYCTVGDIGAPLLIKHNYEYYLVGIYLFKGEVGRRSNPEVFANLQNPRYKQWLRETIPIMQAVTV